MKSFIISVIFWVVSLSYSQVKQVTIVGNLPQQYGGKYISFSKPISEYTTEPSYINSKDTAQIKNNKFIKTLEISGSGLIYVYEKPYDLTSTRFFVEPGDTIFLERQNGEIIFTGKNAKINKMYSDLKYGPPEFSGEVYKIFKNSNDSKEILEKINFKEKEYLDYYNDLLSNKQISKSCLDYTKLLLEHSLDGLAWNIAINREYIEEQKMPITKEESDKIIDHFNLKYASYNKENLKSFFFVGLLRKHALHKEANEIKENKKNLQFWSQFDSVFYPVIDNIGIVDYLEYEDYKEAFIAQYFFDLIRRYDNEKTIRYNDLISVYKMFVEKFPNSAYIIPLSESIMDKTLETLNFNINNAVKTESKITIGSLTFYEEILEPVGSTPLAKPNQSLLDALSEKFPDQDLFIDFWATWCGPCKTLSPILDELSLDRSDVKIVKIDVDQNQELAQKFGIRSIPTLYIMKDGKIEATKMGASSKAALSSWIDSII